MRDLKTHSTEATTQDHKEWSYLALGLEALERGRLAEAETCFGKAIVQELRSPEPWYWMGRLKERQGEPQAAAHCYFWAYECRRYQPAGESLRRLGYLKEE